MFYKTLKMSVHFPLKVHGYIDIKISCLTERFGRASREKRKKKSWQQQQQNSNKCYANRLLS